MIRSMYLLNCKVLLGLALFATIAPNTSREGMDEVGVEGDVSEINLYYLLFAFSCMH